MQPGLRPPPSKADAHQRNDCDRIQVSDISIVGLRFTQPNLRTEQFVILGHTWHFEAGSFIDERNKFQQEDNERFILWFHQGLFEPPWQDQPLQSVCMRVI